jgi:hypothetical protein
VLNPKEMSCRLRVFNERMARGILGIRESNEEGN